jgi:hypothetical protein
VATFLVEHYWPGVTEGELRDAAARVRASSDGMAGLRLLRVTLVPEDEAALCVFAADSAALVVEAYGRAGVRFERILDAVEVYGS